MCLCIVVYKFEIVLGFWLNNLFIEIFYQVDICGDQLLIVIELEVVFLYYMYKEIWDSRIYCFLKRIGIKCMVVIVEGEFIRIFLYIKLFKYFEVCRV